MTPAGGAAARAVRRPRGVRARSGNGSCSASGPASAGSPTSGSTRPERVAVVDVLGESVVVTARRRRRPARVVQRVPAPRLAAVPDRAGSRAAAVRGPVDPMPLPLLDLRARRLAAARAAHGGRRRRAGGVRLQPVGVEAWGGFVFVHLDTPARRPARRRAWRAPTRTLANYDLGSLVTGLTLTYDVAANWKVIAENYNECYHCGPVHPELSRLVPAFAGGGAGPRLGRRHPAPRGRLDVHDDRHDRPGAAARARRGREGAAQGRAGLPEPDAVLLRRPRRRLRAAAAGGRPDRDRVPAAVPPVGGRRRRRSTPSDAGDFWDLVNQQDWAICESVQRGMSSRAYTHGWFAPMEDDSADIRRWLLPRLGARGRRRWLSTSTTSSSGSARSGPARRGTSPRGATRWSGSSSSSSATAGAPPTTPRGSCGTATTRPGYVRLTQEAYDDWARLEADSGERWYGGRRARPVPARCADPARRLRRLDERGGHRLRGARRCRDPAPVAGRSTCPPGHAGALPGARCDRARPPAAPRRCRGSPPGRRRHAARVDAR